MISDSRNALYQLWKDSDRGHTSVLFPPDLSGNFDVLKGKLGRRYRLLWYTFEGGARVLGQLLKQGWHETPRHWRMILSLAFQEIIWDGLDSAYAVVSSYVEIAKREFGKVAGKVVNGTLRSLCRMLEKKQLNRETCFPEYLLSIWQIAPNGLETLMDVLEARRQLYVHSLKGKVHQVPGDAIEWEGGTCINLENGISPKEVIRTNSEEFFFQNLHAAQLSFEVQQRLNRGKLLDYCSAPGGKSWQISKLSKGEQAIDMYEINPKRREMIAKSPLLRKLSKVHVLNEIEPKETYPNVLLDVPCSNSGVLVKSPEAIRHQWRIEDSFSEIQNEILEEGISRVADNGKIFYSTCSIDPRENGARIRKFIKDKGIKMEFEKSWWPTSKGAHGAYLAVIYL